MPFMMATQTKSSTKTEQQAEEARALENEVVEVAERTAEQDALIDDLNDLLDEIDDVLEVNAYEFVKNYIQAGGE